MRNYLLRSLVIVLTFSDGDAMHLNGVAALLLTACVSAVTSTFGASALDRSAPLADAEQSLIDLYARTSPSVVQIVSIQATAEPRGSNLHIGSGFFWDRMGNVVTNEHVVRNATTLIVWVDSGDEVEAEVIGIAKSYDLAVIRLKKAKEPSVPLPIGTSSTLKVGQSAFAIGSPFGLDQSFTAGVISSLKRELPVEGSDPITQMIQTDAAVYPGNSGGPLLNSRGELIGVNTISYSEAGTPGAFGFAIPVDVVKRVVPQLIEKGNASTASIGVTAHPVFATPKRAPGLSIAAIAPGSPAERAGLQPADVAKDNAGDIIVSANGRPVHTALDLSLSVEQSGIGKVVKLLIFRAGHLKKIEVEVADGAHLK